MPMIDVSNPYSETDQDQDMSSQPPSVFNNITNGLTLVNLLVFLSQSCISGHLFLVLITDQIPYLDLKDTDQALVTRPPSPAV